MRIRPLAVIVVAVAGFHASGSSADAQVARGVFGGPRTFVGPGGPVTLTPGYGYPGAAPTSAPPSAGFVAPYSYYAVPPGQPARTYSGPEEFPFYGRPYGHVYDRWNWQYMSNGSNGTLARYYYSPL